MDNGVRTEGAIHTIFNFFDLFSIRKVTERHFRKDDNGVWQDCTLGPQDSLVIGIGNLRCEFTYYKYPKVLKSAETSV